jgi:hypothetical protein
MPGAGTDRLELPRIMEFRKTQFSAVLTIRLNCGARANAISHPGDALRHLLLRSNTFDCAGKNSIAAASFCGIKLQVCFSNNIQD